MGEQQIEPFAYQKSTNIDEHNQIVDKVNEIVGVINGVELDEVNNKITALQSAVATNTTDIATNASDIDSLADTVDAQATSIATNKTNIESLRDANIIITKDIESIKETDTEQNTQITALDNADIATATSEFDNTARKLTITLNPKSGDAITAETIIPASGETGDDYTATAPIAIANKDISLAIDTDTMEITDDGKLKSKADGKTYVAGSGISIDDTTNAISVDETVIATKATTDNLDTQIKECATGVANAITQAQTANTNALDAYNAVTLSDTHLVLTKGNGNSDEIVLPSGGDDWLPVNDITDKDITKFKIGTRIIGNALGYSGAQIEYFDLTVTYNSPGSSRYELVGHIGAYYNGSSFSFVPLHNFTGIYYSGTKISQIISFYNDDYAKTRNIKSFVLNSAITYFVNVYIKY